MDPLKAAAELHPGIDREDEAPDRPDDPAIADLMMHLRNARLALSDARRATADASAAARKAQAEEVRLSNRADALASALEALDPQHKIMHA